MPDTSPSSVGQDRLGPDNSPRDRRPIIISGPSGAGKGTLMQMLFDAHPNVFAATVSHTTRAPRNGEVDGVNYTFVSVPEFESLILNDAFVEHARFSGHYYGTSKQTIAEPAARGLVAVLDIDMQGVQQMKARDGFDARYIFVKPPSIEVLEERLRSRGTEDEDAIKRRLIRAQTELEHAETRGAHDVIIVNDKIDEAFRQLDEYIYDRDTHNSHNSHNYPSAFLGRRVVESCPAFDP